MRAAALLIACCLTPISLLAEKHSVAGTPEPNVFLITIDTLRADHVHCYGYQDIETPAIDSVSKDGLRFAQAFTPSPITNTSHTTIMTGLLPSSHGVTDFALPLALSHVTWAELLKQRGYQTAAFIGAVILDSHSLAPGLDRGFDFYDNFPENLPERVHWGRVERRGMDVAQRAEKWLTAHPAAKHFVWVHLYDPHDPYEPPPPYSRTYKSHLYDGEIAYADSALANFIQYIKNRGWYENAIIVIVGDHGEGLGEHGENTHGIFLYDSTTHVPLILKLPGDAGAGKVIGQQVRTTDILPTVLDLLDIRVANKFDGASLKPFFNDDEQSRVAFGETDYPLRFGWAPLRSVREPGFKFIEAPRPELYDLHQDPGELHNNYVPWDQTVQKSRTLLAELRAKMPPPAPSAATVPAGTVDELKALGYLSKADFGTSTNVPEPSLLPDPKDKIQEANLLHTAMMAGEDNRSLDARAAMEKVLQLDPKSPTALRQLGEMELKSGEYAKAARHLQTAREIRPDDAAAAFDEGQALYKLREFAGARDALESSLKLAPEQLEARLLLGRVYLELNNPKAAEDQFEAATLLDSKSLDAQLGIAQCAIAEGNQSTALEQLKSLSVAHPRNAEVFDLLAKIYRSIGNDKDAGQAEARARTLRKSEAGKE
jgi:arylsulfatase A-like enzyme/Flp pilus assembly protein TadD